MPSFEGVRGYEIFTINKNVHFTYGNEHGKYSRACRATQESGQEMMSGLKTGFTTEN